MHGRCRSLTGCLLFPTPFAVPQAAGLRFAGLEEGRFLELHGVFTVDPERPVANGRPHYRTASGGGHLYYHSGSGNWFLTVEGYSPDKPNASACFPTAGAVPVGAAVWRYHDGKQWVDRELTVAELTAAEVAAAERADDDDYWR